MWNPFRKKKKVEEPVLIMEPAPEPIVEPVVEVVVVEPVVEVESTPEPEAPALEIKMGDTEVKFTPGPAVTTFDPAQIERYKLSRDQIANYLADCTLEGRKRNKLGDEKFQAKLDLLRKELAQLEKICKAFE